MLALLLKCYTLLRISTLCKILCVLTRHPCPTSAPGEAPGTYAFEVAMDELAAKTKRGPHSVTTHQLCRKRSGRREKWFSEKNLKECYDKGAESIGWKNRNNKPGMKEGNT